VSLLLQGAVAPAERIGPGVAAAIDQSIEGEPGIGVVSKLAPGFGRKELPNQILPFRYGEGAGILTAAATRLKRARRSARVSV
jgi:hypothetical protein